MWWHNMNSGQIYYWREELTMAKIAHEPVKRAMSRIRELSADEEARRLAFVRERAMRDEVSQLNEARQEGEQIGLAKGEQIGLEKGEQIGLEKGEQIGLEKGEQIGLERGERLRAEKDSPKPL
ncbi:hypothetical protein HH1059_17610 [Halorhodospira halochloris]|uniref:Uncharacterized protein n=2 Tax=Halorhodospira halochloris TaxID=1052 RepID=A0A2Z6EZS4_HALHR|nr:hypothetical protein HH1059_17610 [Halorhodospira halochloris]